MEGLPKVLQHVAASGQVELVTIIGEDLPAGYNIHTAPEWAVKEYTAAAVIRNFKILKEWNNGKTFP